MITLKEYAKLNHITYEAVRSQVNRYREQLGDHIVQDGRQQLLDDYAVAFLDERRQKNPVVVYQQSKDEVIEEMRKELEGAYKTIAAQAVMITDLQQFKIAAMENKQALEDEKTAQERRERELDEREGQMAQQISEAAQKAAEDVRRAVEEEKDQEIAQIHQEASEIARRAAENEKILEGFIQDAKNELTAVQVDAQTKLDEKDAIIQEQEKKIQALESRSRWQRFLDVFK